MLQISRMILLMSSIELQIYSFLAFLTFEIEKIKVKILTIFYLMAILKKIFTSKKYLRNEKKNLKSFLNCSKQAYEAIPRA